MRERNNSSIFAIRDTRPPPPIMKATAPLLKHWRKLPLTTKDINKGFYKGNRTGSMGRHTKYGGYVVDYSKVRTYVVPDLTGFQV